MHANQLTDQADSLNVNTPINHTWHSQSDFKFGYVPLSEQIMPTNLQENHSNDMSPFEMHKVVKATAKPNFMQAHLPVMSQLNTEAWEIELRDYWDKQLLQLLKFGFPLDFNRANELKQDGGNHRSALDYPKDIEAYLYEKLQYEAILGPYKTKPIPNMHCSPFMTRATPNSDKRGVIIDLSWPIGASVNAGIDKTTYIDSAFALNFPTVDHITSELKRLGRGAHLYKIDVSRAFWHIKVDPGDYDLLGLEWNGFYVDTCIPFGTRHRSQIFQRLSKAVRFIMRRSGFTIIDYTDDYVRVGVPSIASASYAFLLQLMQRLGLTVSEKKLVPPGTRVVSLGILIDTICGTVEIPAEKLQQINITVRQWLGKDVAMKRELQSILGLLLYIHKCVRPVRIFLNRMLEVLRSSHSTQKITLTGEFKHDLRWFARFLPDYNGVSLYDHKPIDIILELDVCLTGFGGCSGIHVYHLPIQRGYRNWSIVHLEMINILLALRLFKHH